MDASTTPPNQLTLAANVNARVMAYNRFTTRMGDISGLRPAIQSFLGDRVSVGLLKHADELTLVTLVAIDQAMKRFHLSAEQQTGWGVIANPSTPGRTRMVDTLTKYPIQGAWSVTPHFVPHCMLHSMPGLLTQALDIHGPNMGVGGSASAVEDVCLGMAAWLGCGDTHGGWMVWAKWLTGRMDSPDCVAESIVVAVEKTDDQSPQPVAGWAAIEALFAGEQP